MKIACVLGTDSLWTFLKKYGLAIDAALFTALGKYVCKTVWMLAYFFFFFFSPTHNRHQCKKWDKFVNASNKHVAVPEALDFLDKLLKYDPADRITAEEAMAHPYFSVLKR